jgi:hypothetical protein
MKIDNLPSQLIVSKIPHMKNNTWYNKLYHFRHYLGDLGGLLHR